MGCAESNVDDADVNPSVNNNHEANAAQPVARDMDYKNKLISYDDNYEYLSIPAFKFTLSFLRKVVFSEKCCITHIDKLAFANCQFLTNVVISGSVEEIAEGSFFNCINLSNFSIIGEPHLTLIGDSSFEWTQIHSFKFPQSLKKIGNRAFHSCRMKIIDLHETNLESIGNEAFCGNPITKFFLPNTLKIMKMPFLQFDNKEFSFRIAEGSKLIQESREGYTYSAPVKGVSFVNPNKKRIFLRRGIERLMEDSFKNSIIKKICIPASVKEICTSAFSSCKSLSNIDFMDNSTLQIIHPTAFKGCSSLRSIIFPSSLKQIHKSAFQGTSLENVIFPSDSHLEFISSCFASTKVKNLCLPSSLMSIDGNILQEMKSLESVEILNLHYEFINGLIVTKDKSFVVSCIHSIEEAQIPEGIKAIKSHAFEHSNIVSITIPSSVEKIESKAFDQAEKLKSIIFEENSCLVEIGECAFSNTLVTNLSLPPSVMKIHLNSLAGSSHISSLTINNEIYHTDSEGIVHCSSPVGIVFCPNTVREIDLDENLEDIYANVFRSSRIYTISIPKSIKRIGVEAFYRASIDDINFDPQSRIELIDKAAFNYTIIPEVILPQYVGIFDLSSFMCKVVFPKGFTGKKIKCDSQINPSEIVCPRELAPLFAGFYFQEDIFTFT